MARGARLAKSPAEVASAADIVLASLPTPDIVKAVALGPDGIVAGNRATVMIDLSTTGPGTAKLIAAGFEARNITLVDAPVSGGIKGAVNGTLAVMVSCPKATYDRGRADSEDTSASCFTPATSRAWRRPRSSPTT